MLSVTLTLLTVEPSFDKTLWLVMMHHHTVYGYKRLTIQQIPSGQIVKEGFNLRFELGSEAIFSQSPWLMMMYHQTKLGSKRIRSSEYTIETLIF